MKTRAFTLMETAIAMALVGIVAICATMLYGSVIRTFSQTRKTITITDRSQAVIDYLTHEIRSVGGNGIPASAAIFVEDDALNRGDPVMGFPDGSDSQAGVEGRAPILGRADRLTMFTALQNVPPCPITAIAGPMIDGSGTAQFVERPAGAPPFCCFTTGGGPRAFQRTAMLMNNGFYRPVLLTNSSGTCTFQWQDIVPPAMRTMPDPTSGMDMNAAFNNGLAVLVDFRTVYLDPVTHDLVMHLDRNFTDSTLNGFGQNPTVAGERMRILDGVYDFQVSLGYDLDFSGDVPDTASPSDEWLYNTPGETMSGFVDPFDARQLRLVRVEAVVGIKSEGPSGGASVSSPARTVAPVRVPGVALRAVGTRLAPRNVDLPSFGGP
jgi:hypothetical protein